jgi:hypothetical protein
VSQKDKDRADDLIRNAEQAKWAEYLRVMEQESAAREQESAAREPKTMAQIKEEVKADGPQPGDDDFGEAMRAKKSKYQEEGRFQDTAAPKTGQGYIESHPVGAQSTYLGSIVDKHVPFAETWR